LVLLPCLCDPYNPGEKRLTPNMGCWSAPVNGTDTLPPLKGVGFGANGATTSARVKSSTPPKRSEIHDGLNLNKPIRSMPCTRADITCPVRIAMDHCATARTDIDPSSWCTVLYKFTTTACACRIVFWNIASFHSILCGLIGNILHELTMRPLADLLV